MGTGPVNVVVYTTPWCPACKRAKRWLNANGIPFEERDVEVSRQNAQKMRALNPRGTIPTFQVGSEVLIGFDDRELVAAIARARAR